MRVLLALAFICAWGAADAANLPQQRSSTGEAHSSFSDFSCVFGGMCTDGRGLRISKHRTKHVRRHGRLSARAHSTRTPGHAVQSPERKSLPLAKLTRGEVDLLWSQFLWWRAHNDEVFGRQN